MVEISRRGLLKGVGAAILAPEGLLKAPPLTSKEAWLRAFNEADAANKAVFNINWEIHGAMESTAGINIAQFTEQLFVTFGRLNSSFQALLHADAEYTKTGAKSPLQRLTEARNAQSDQLAPLPNDKIKSILKEVGITEDVWNNGLSKQWRVGETFASPSALAERINADQLYLTRVIVDDYTKDIDNSTDQKAIAQQLQNAFEGKFPGSFNQPRRYIALEKDPSENTLSIGEHTQKLLEEREKGDLLGELDHNGSPRGSDVY